MFKHKLAKLTLVFLLALANFLYAQETINIAGREIPLMAEAQLVSDGMIAGTKANVATYAVNKSLEEVISFYQLFLKENDFLLIAGMEEPGFNAAVKKGSSMFSLKIYPQGQRTIIQFIW